MKNIFAATTLLCALLFSTPGLAAWPGQMDAAIARNDFGRINTIAANNPGALGDIAMFLLQKARDRLPDIDAAAKIFLAAVPFIIHVPPGDAGQAAGILLAVETAAKETDFQQKDCRGAITILGAALTMSSVPNIAAAAPNLHADFLADANAALEENPACDSAELQNEVSLAQVPTVPTIGALGALTPSAD